MDGSPIIDRTPVDGPLLNAGWCYGGFKATPASGWCFAHLIATRRSASGREPPPARPLRDRLHGSTNAAPARSPICTRGRHAHSLPSLRRTRPARVPVSRRCNGAQRPSADSPTAMQDFSSTCTPARTRPARIANSGFTTPDASAGWWLRATRRTIPCLRRNWRRNRCGADEYGRGHDVDRLSHREASPE